MHSQVLLLRLDSLSLLVTSDCRTPSHLFRCIQAFGTSPFADGPYITDIFLYTLCFAFSATSWSSQEVTFLLSFLGT
ncbi:hypothetical protein BT96DRAFT_508073 [Gymnopus androsaceus JB14]|uniref:Uncharacterized protein n=1 Tax=Gymnopus androsaceus JB14 TaxID=1447944 RepID=A0A6A4GN79_9AGAR|nr:hypothetical protein BT96DRAFT_508073 [Gymnopus androsaceus JB14]